MAKVNLSFPISGKMGNYSFYHMAGAKHIVIRLKGGPTKEQIKTHPKFYRQRKNMCEFAGCSKAAAYISSALFGFKPLSNANYMGRLTQLCGSVLKMSDDDPGKRPVLFSRFGHLLPGFNVNTNTSFDDLVLQYTPSTISRTECSATINFPPMLPGVNLKAPEGFAYCRLIGILGILPDMLLEGKSYMPTTKECNPFMERTGWIPMSGFYHGETMKLKLARKTMEEENGILILSVGIEFGSNLKGEGIITKQGIGGGKILAVG